MKHFLEKRNLTIFGAGGSAKASPPPVITLYPAVLTPPVVGDANQLSSFSYAEMIDLISDGPIEGLVNKNGNKVYDENIFEGIYLNDVAVKETSRSSSYPIDISVIKYFLKDLWKDSLDSIVSLPTDGSKNIQKNVTWVDILTQTNESSIMFDKGFSITSYHPDESIYQLINQTNQNFDLISKFQRTFDSAPISNERPFLTVIDIPKMIVPIDVNLFDFTEGGANAPYPLFLSIKNLSEHVYFSIGLNSFDSFNYFEMPRSFIYNSQVTPNGKKTFLKNPLSVDRTAQNVFARYEFLNLKIFLWSIYSEDFGIKKIGNVLDQYFKNIYVNQNNASLFNYNLVNSEFRNGSQDQLQFNNFKNIEIDVNYGKELIGPFKVLNTSPDLTDAKYGFGVTRLKNLCCAESQQILSAAELKAETSDDIRYVKSWPVEYDKAGNPAIISGIKFNYAVFDKNTASRVQQDAVPVTHYVTNQNVEDIYISLNVSALSDTNHIDLVSPDSIGLKGGQTSAPYQGALTYDELTNACSFISNSVQTGYLIVVGNDFNNGYVIGGGKCFKENFIFCDLENITRKGDIYNKIMLSELNSLYDIQNKLSPQYDLTPASPLLDYIVPNEYEEIATTSFQIKDYLQVDALSVKLKNLKEDNSLYYEFGLASRDSLMPQNDKNSTSNNISYMSSFSTFAKNFYNQLTVSFTANTSFSETTTSPIFNIGQVTDIKNRNTSPTSIINKGQNKIFIVGYNYYTLSKKDLTNRNLITTDVSSFIPWRKIFSGVIYSEFTKFWSLESLQADNVQTNSLLGAASLYPNINKYLVSVVQAKQPIKKVRTINGVPGFYYSISLPSRNIYALGFYKAYLDSREDIWEIDPVDNKKYFKLSFLENLIEDYVLKIGGEITNISADGAEIVSFSISNAFKNIITPFENGKLLSGSSIYSIKLSNLSFLNEATLSSLKIKNNFNYTIYNISSVYLLYQNQDGLSRDTVDLTYDGIFTYSLYSNQGLGTTAALNKNYNLGGNKLYLEGGDKASGGKTGPIKFITQNITAGTRLPSVVSIEVETGYEKDEKNSFLESVFKYRFDIFGISSDQTILDIGRKSYNFIKSQKVPLISGGIASNLRKITVRKKIYFYKLASVDENVLLEEMYFISDKKDTIVDFNLNKIDTFTFPSQNGAFLANEQAYQFFTESSAISTVGQSVGIRHENSKYNFYYFLCYKEALEGFAQSIDSSEFGSCIKINELNLNSAANILKKYNLLKDFEIPTVTTVKSKSLKSSNATGVDCFRIEKSFNSSSRTYTQVDVYTFEFDCVEVFDPIDTSSIEAYSSNVYFAVYFEYSKYGFSELPYIMKKTNDPVYSTQLFINDYPFPSTSTSPYKNTKYVLRISIRRLMPDTEEELLRQSYGTRDIFTNNYSTRNTYYISKFMSVDSEYLTDWNNDTGNIFTNFNGLSFSNEGTIAPPFFKSGTEVESPSSNLISYTFKETFDLKSKRAEILNWLNSFRFTKDNKIVNVDALIDTITKYNFPTWFEGGDQNLKYSLSTFYREFPLGKKLASQILSTRAFSVPLSPIAEIPSSSEVAQQQTTKVNLNIAYWTLLAKEKNRLSIILPSFDADSFYENLTNKKTIEYVELTQFLEDFDNKYELIINSESLQAFYSKSISYTRNNRGSGLMLYGQNKGKANFDNSRGGGNEDKIFPEGGFLKLDPLDVIDAERNQQILYSFYEHIFKENFEGNSKSVDGAKIKIITIDYDKSLSIPQQVANALKDINIFGDDALPADITSNNNEPKFTKTWTVKYDSKTAPYTEADQILVFKGEPPSFVTEDDIARAQEFAKKVIMISPSSGGQGQNSATSIFDMKPTSYAYGKYYYDVYQLSNGDLLTFEGVVFTKNSPAWNMFFQQGQYGGQYRNNVYRVIAAPENIDISSSQVESSNVFLTNLLKRLEDTGESFISYEQFVSMPRINNQVIQHLRLLAQQGGKNYYFSTIKSIESGGENVVNQDQILDISYYPSVQISNTLSYEGEVSYATAAQGTEILLPVPKYKENNDIVRRYVKVTRLSHETMSPLISKKISLQKITEIIPQNFSYPFSAMVATKIDSRAFSQIPNRTFDCKLKKVLVPSNYFTEDPETGEDVRYLQSARGRIIYDKNWDGSFKLSWTNNPAWIIMDLLINKRYGLGNHIESSQIDIWELYKISRWCDGVDEDGRYWGVPDSYGGHEPRHAFNAIIEEKFNIFEIINQIASVFRGSVYYMNSLITFDDDRPKLPAGEFTNSDVKDGIFNYTNLRKDEEYTALDIAFIDEKNNYKPSIEYVEDQDSIRKRGILKRQINAFGITSRGQARRFAKHILYHTAKEKLNVSFTTDIKALMFRPGDIIQIHDELFTTYKNFGKVLKIEDIDETKFKVVIDQALDSGIYLHNEISLHVPISKPSRPDLEALVSFAPPKINVTQTSLFKNFIYSYLTGLYNIAPDSSSYVTRDYTRKIDNWYNVPVNQRPPIQYSTVNGTEEYATGMLDLNTLKSIINANKNGIFSNAIGVEEIGLGAYIDIKPFSLYKDDIEKEYISYTGRIKILHKKNYRRYYLKPANYIIDTSSGSHWGESLTFKYLNVKLIYNQEQSNITTPFGAWSFIFETPKIKSYLVFDTQNQVKNIFTHPYFHTFFDNGMSIETKSQEDGTVSVKTKEFKIPPSDISRYGTAKFEYSSDAYWTSNISYQSILESERPTVETFTINTYQTGFYNIEVYNKNGQSNYNEVATKYSELILNKTGANGKIKESVIFNLNNLKTASSYSLNLIGKEKSFFKINSINENYINEYNILATQYSEDKYQEIEQFQIPREKVETTFNALYYYDRSTRTIDLEKSLNSPIINNIYKYISQDNRIGLIIDWEMSHDLIETVTYKIYIQTPSKQTANIELTANYSNYNPTLGMFRYTWNGNSLLNNEFGTYTVHIMASIKDGDLNKFSNKNSKSVTILDY